MKQYEVDNKSTLKYVGIIFELNCTCTPSIKLTPWSPVSSFVKVCTTVRFILRWGEFKN